MYIFYYLELEKFFVNLLYKCLVIRFFCFFLYLYVMVINLIFRCNKFYLFYRIFFIFYCGFIMLDKVMLEI